MHDVLVHGLTMEQDRGSAGFGGKSWVEYFGKRFRECLDSMAIYYGLAMPKKLALGVDSGQTVVEKQGRKSFGFPSLAQVRPTV